MRRIFRAVSIAGCMLAVFSMVSAAQAELVEGFWNKVKDQYGLVDGQTIRIVFATSTTTDASSSIWDDYDNFGDSAAASGIITGGLSLGYDVPDVEWQPLVSTASGSPASPVTDWLENNYADIPVFNTNGERVAENSFLMTNSGLDLPVRYDESGDDQTLDYYDQQGEPVRSTRPIWTGTLGDGSPANFPDLIDFNEFTLGSEDDFSVVGDANATTTDWLAYNTMSHGSRPSNAEGSGDFPPGFEGDQLPGIPIEQSIYVMSGAVTVVPEPSTVLLWLGFSGLAGLIYWRKRRS